MCAQLIRYVKVNMQNRVKQEFTLILSLLKNVLFIDSASQF